MKRAIFGLGAKYPSFWVFQISGWLLYFILVALALWTSESLTAFAARDYATGTAIGFLTSLGLRYVYGRVRFQEQSFFSLSVISLSGAFFASIISVALSVLLRPDGSLEEMWFSTRSFQYYLASFVSWMVPFLGWTALYFGIKYWREGNIQREKADRATALAQTAQLLLLRFRLNPHFLFNTLNAIRALIGEDKASAKKMITELSDYLRYSLVSKDCQDVPFKDEVDSIRHFFAIQKMRYEAKLEVVFDLDPAAEEFPIASFILHPLAENALKFGLQTSPLPLSIRLASRVRKGNLLVDIVNSGAWVEPSDRTGENSPGGGLDNVRRRLAESYPDAHQFDIFEQEGYVWARLRLGKPQRGSRA